MTATATDSFVWVKSTDGEIHEYATTAEAVRDLLDHELGVVRALEVFGRGIDPLDVTIALAAEMRDAIREGREEREHQEIEGRKIHV